MMFCPEHVDEFLPLLEEGAARAGRSLDGFRIAPSVNFLVSDDEAAARDAVRPFLALYVGGMGSREKNFYNKLAQRYGYEENAKKVQDLYLDGKKEEAAARCRRASSTSSRSSGARRRIRDKMQVFREAGDRHARHHAAGVRQGRAGSSSCGIAAELNAA